MAPSRQQLAYHESGHLVMAILAGFTVLEASIEPSRYGHGFVSFNSRLPPPALSRFPKAIRSAYTCVKRDYHFRQIMVFMSGIIGEFILLKQVGVSDGFGGDDESIESLLPHVANNVEITRRALFRATLKLLRDTKENTIAVHSFAKKLDLQSSLSRANIYQLAKTFDLQPKKKEIRYWIKMGFEEQARLYRN